MNWDIVWNTLIPFIPVIIILWGVAIGTGCYVIIKSRKQNTIGDKRK